MHKRIKPLKVVLIDRAGALAFDMVGGLNGNTCRQAVQRLVSILDCSCCAQNKERRILFCIEASNLIARWKDFACGQDACRSFPRGGMGP